ncbi:N-acetylglucosamine kinase [Tautonia plasticadhaerens]|uniref:BadF/BadG/BcrA/BcrD ATPase family protein n=1 Tax=Tautonia plasticadhaerens TaxID=2527974 RepID=A0A518GYD1_9BACT|nr:BadF/BadG/BcrA/BcrD ATPase family protein [Tautonia plasticadhaerens]QDV33595.1 BadF/BadG/BcrA/BcrD ATPase family protein [Tautonia plasticadhaerens]
MSDPLVIGVDGGGTSTEAWLADAGGTVLGRGTAGPSNAKAVGDDRARRALSEAIDSARADAGIGDRPVAVACLGLAGFDRPDDRARLASWCEQGGWAGRLVPANDGDLVLAAGTPEGFGIALIAGTGSIAVGKAPGGRSARAGGWGPLIGDEGSAYSVALAGLRLVARRFDGRSDRPAEDSLTGGLCEALGVPSPGEIVSVLYGPAWDRARIAGLARIVVACADGDIEVRDHIFGPAAEELADLVVAVRESTGWDDAPNPPPLAVAGGFLLAAEGLRVEVLKLLGDWIGPVGLVEEPVAGAVMLARRALG